MLEKGGIPLDEWSGAKATNELHQTIKEFNKVTTRQTNHILRLTIVIAFLTFVMLIGLGIQIYLAIGARRSVELPSSEKVTEKIGAKSESEDQNSEIPHNKQLQPTGKSGG